jgi:hypothetical protein
LNVIVEEIVMKAAITTFIATTATTTMAYAANGSPLPEPGVLCWACIGLCAAVLVGQTIPAVRLVMGTNGLHTPPSAANQG